MFVMINGSFGIGKTTVARELRRLIPHSAIFDPEWVGLVLQRMQKPRPSDFQDLPSWRRLTIHGARGVAKVSGTVIIPMAFSNITYLDEVRAGLASSGGRVHHFCLTAPLEVVRDRLKARAEPLGDDSWVHRRAEECCAAHQASAFAIQIATEGRSPHPIAMEILWHIRRAEDLH